MILSNSFSRNSCSGCIWIFWGAATHPPMSALPHLSHSPETVTSFGLIPRTPFCLTPASSQKALPTAPSSSSSKSPQASPISGTTSGFQEFLHLLHWPLILEVRIPFCCFMRIKAIMLFHWNAWKDSHLHLLVCTDVYTCVCTGDSNRRGLCGPCPSGDLGILAGGSYFQEWWKFN